MIGSHVLPAPVGTPVAVTTLLLVRHGTTDLTGKRLYGRSQDVGLSDEGRGQADRLGERLARLRPSALYTSPIRRCAETADRIAEACRLETTHLDGLAEIDYGRWTGRSFASLARTKLWRRVHRVPSSVRFPAGETLAEAQRRIVDALEGIVERHPRGLVGVVSHGDPIAMALAHYAGIHLDLFQRLQVAPGSISAVSVSDGLPRILLVNDSGSLEQLRPPRGKP
jgi:probable phosphomutase (TIGR03848 family)